MSLTTAELDALFAPDDDYLAYLDECQAYDDEVVSDVVDEEMECQSEHQEIQPLKREKEGWGRFELRAMEEVWGDGVFPDVEPKRATPTQLCTPSTLFGISKLPSKSLSVVSEDQMVLLLLSCLQGLPCYGLTMTNKEGFILNSDVVCPDISPSVLREMISPVLSLGTVILSIRSGMDSLRKQSTAYSPVQSEKMCSISPLVPSLTSVIAKVLCCTTTLFMEVQEANIIKTIPELISYIRKTSTEECLNQLAKVLTTTVQLSQDSCGSTVLLSRLYRWAEKCQERGLSCSTIASAVLLETLQPYLVEITDWVSTGSLGKARIQEQMIFITEVVRRKLDPFTDWDERWKIVNERLPCFISQETAHLILVSGKSVRFLQTLRNRQLQDSNICHVPVIDISQLFNEDIKKQGSDSGGNPTAALRGGSQNANRHLASLPTCNNGVPIGSIITNTIENIITKHSNTVGIALVSALQKECDIDKYMNILSGFHLLHQGDVMQYFCSRYLFPIASSCSWGTKPSNDQIQDSFRSSLLLYHNDNNNIVTNHCNVKWEDEGQDASSLRFSSGDDVPRLPVDKARPPNCLRIVSGFVQKLTIPPSSQLNIIFPPEVIAAYTRVQQVLLLTSYSQHLLVNCRLPRMTWRLTGLERQIISTRVHLLHFIQALYDQLLQKTTSIWKKGINALSEVTSVAGFRKGHSRLANHLLDAVNFSRRTKDHWATLLSIIRLVVKFEECTRLYIQWLRSISITKQKYRNFSDIEIPPLVRDSIRLLPSTLSQDIMSQFRRAMQLFISALHQQTGSTKSAEMIARFDFSNVYGGTRMR